LFTASQLPFSVQFLSDAYTSSAAAPAPATGGFKLVYFLTTC